MIWSLIRCSPISLRSTAFGSVGGRSYTPKTSVFKPCYVTEKLCHMLDDDSAILLKDLNYGDVRLH